jgi:hypothetical protein
MAGPIPKRDILPKEEGAEVGGIRASSRCEEVDLPTTPRLLDVAHPLFDHVVGLERGYILVDVMDPDADRASDRFLRDLRRGFVRIRKPTVVEKVKLDSFLDCQSVHRGAVNEFGEQRLLG